MQCCPDLSPCQENCLIGWICTTDIPPTHCIPLYSQACFDACESGGGGGGGGGDGDGDGDGGGGGGGDGGGGGGPPVVYNDCCWEGGFFKHIGESIADICVAGVPPTDNSPCPASPSQCASGCCCCSSAVLAEKVATRCYDRVTVSCNADGSGPAPGESFPANCDFCFDACDLLLNDPDGCNKLKDLPWWNLDNSACACFCKEPVTPAEGGQPDCNLTCAVCGKCDADIEIENVQCEYKITLSPSNDCCKQNKADAPLLIWANFGSARIIPDEGNAIVGFTNNLSDFIQAHPEYDTVSLPANGGGTGVGTVFAIEHGQPAASDNWCIGYPGTCEGPDCPNIDRDGCIMDACLIPFCPECADIVSFTNLLINHLCNNKENYLNTYSRIEVVIMVHGYADATQLASKVVNNLQLQKLLKDLNTTVHAVNFTIPCIKFRFTEINLCGQIGLPLFINVSPVSYIPDPECENAGVYITCVEASLLYSDFYYVPNTTSLSLLFIRLTNPRPPASCQCIDDSVYTITLDSRDCSDKAINVCGTTIIVGAPDGQTTCCDQIGCFCSSDCPPYKGSEDCEPVSECKCGVECLPVCDGGELLFSTMEAAIEANWQHCLNHGTPSDELLDCVYIDFAQPWEAPDIRLICKTEIEATVEAAWLSCVGGIGGGEGGGGVGGGEGGGGGGQGGSGGGGSGGGGPGPVSIIGCGYWPPTNVDCGNDIIVGQETGCSSVRHPDVLVLNNGIGLIAYEDTTDDSVINIKQVHSSIKNKIRPNRKLRYGRLENVIRWITPDSSLNLPADSAFVKLYYYEPTGSITTWENSSQEDADILFFFNGPFKNQVLTIYSTGIDSIGEYIHLFVPTMAFSDWSLDYISAVFISEDDRYDIQWAIYDQSDTYQDNPDGNYIGTAPISTDVDPDLNATIEDNNAILSLSPHYYNGQKVPVAYPSITHLDNYDNENENSHFVYVAYQALEDNKWKIYLRQLRLSEYKKSDDVFLSESNLILLSDAGINNIIWTCRVSCVSYDCDEDIKTATIKSVWTAKTEDGLPVYNMHLPLGSNSVCGQMFHKNILTVVLSQQTSWSGEEAQCPDKTMVMNWTMGDEITSAVPSFNDTLNQDEINTWTNTVFATIIDNLPVDINVSDSLITAQLMYHQSLGGGWGTFTDSTTQIATKYKGLYVSDPVIICENENGHCTHPVVQADYANRIFVAFESVENGLQQIKIAGTEIPENSLPIGADSAWASLSESFDKVFNFFYSPSGFTYQKQVTENGINQHPRIWIDLNNVIHLTWQSNRDNQWEIYYANSDTEFSNIRITKYDSKSLNPDINGDNRGKLFIVWHDNRFGPWEIMTAFFEGSRILPLFQQNEYLASFRNNYTHSINSVIINTANETSSSFCFNDIVVSFYEDRYLTTPKFTVKKSDYPFAFSESTNINASQTQYMLSEQYCLAPGETKEFILTLMPEIFINPKISSTSELPIGLKQNKTYFTGVSVILDSSETKEMPTQYQSTSCSDCTGVPLKFDYTSCSINFDIGNDNAETKYLSVRLKFYTDSALTNLVETIDTTNAGIDSFAVNGDLANSLWDNGGLKIDSGKIVHITCYPALSRSTGLLCGYSYWTVTEVSYSDSKNIPSDNWSLLNTDAYYWICNCQSVRWGEEAPVSISDLYRWQSSGYGYSDTRITISPGNSLNPRIKVYESNKGIILYQSDRVNHDNYLIYGSVFTVKPNMNMRASGTMINSDILEAKSLIWEAASGTEVLTGQNPVFDTDTYDNIFLAYENNQTSENNNSYGKEFVFNDNTQSTINVHKCGFSDSSDPCASIYNFNSSYILSSSAPNDLMSEMTKKIRVKNEYVRYHITRNKIPTPVVIEPDIIFTIIGSPEVVAIRFRNENTTIWSAWVPFEPTTGNYQAEMPWNLSSGSGLKRTYFQFAAYQGVTTTTYIDIVADYKEIEYEIRLYSSGTRTPDVQLPYLNQVPVASVLSGTQSEQDIFVDIIPSVDYVNKFSSPSLGAPTFNVFTQGNADITDQPTNYVSSETGNTYQGSFKITRSSSSFSQDGLAIIVPHFINDAAAINISTSEIDQFNLFTTSGSNSAFSRDELGKIKYSITSRPKEDPYIVFGDPNYRLDKDNS